MIGIREKLLAAFEVEYREHLEAIRVLLADFAQRKEGSGISQLDEVFRRAHSLKGAARAVDLMPIERVAHKLETLFSRLRGGQIKIDAEVVALVGATLDAIEDWVAASGQGQPLPDIDIAIAAVLSFLGLGVRAPTPSWGLMIAEGRSYMFFKPYLIVLPGLALFLLIVAINMLGDGIRDVTAPEGRA